RGSAPRRRLGRQRQAAQEQGDAGRAGQTAGAAVRSLGHHLASSLSAGPGCRPSLPTRLISSHPEFVVPATTKEPRVGKLLALVLTLLLAACGGGGDQRWAGAGAGAGA